MTSPIFAIISFLFFGGILFIAYHSFKSAVELFKKILPALFLLLLLWIIMLSL